MPDSLPSPAREMSESETLKQEFKQFVYGASHDLNSYARGMIEFSKLLMEEEAKNLSDEGKLYLSMILENGQKLHGMMDSLVEFSRLNTMEKPFTKVDCNVIVQNILIASKDKIKAKQAKIAVGQLPTLNADVDQLTQLFWALINNSLKFVEPGQAPEINISAESRGDYWQFIIKDSGIGIEPVYFDRVFEAFKRLNSDIDYPGPGIGLTLAKKIVTRHGGKIWLDQVEKGCVINFTIPASL